MTNCMNRYHKKVSKLRVNIKSYYCNQGKLEIQDTFNRIRDFILFLNTDVVLKNLEKIQNRPDQKEKIEMLLKQGL